MSNVRIGLTPELSGGGAVRLERIVRRLTCPYGLVGRDDFDEEDLEQEKNHAPRC
mgnify:CR=1 FL=1